MSQLPSSNAPHRRRNPFAPRHTRQHFGQANADVTRAIVSDKYQDRHITEDVDRHLEYNLVEEVVFTQNPGSSGGSRRETTDACKNEEKM